MRKSYCNLLRIVMDSVYEIENFKINLKNTYIKMKEIWLN